MSLLSDWLGFGQTGLGIGDLVCTRILFERAVPVAHLHHGTEVHRKKSGNGPRLFELRHVPALMGEHAAGQVFSNFVLRIFNVT